MKDKSVLIAKNVVKDFGHGALKLHVLKGINLELHQGSSYAICGVSGSGKSTLLHILGGLDFPTIGEVFFNGRDLNKLNLRHKDSFLNKSVGFVFQFHYLVNELTVVENVMLQGLISGEKRLESYHRAKNLLIEVGLESKLESYPTKLSGGELQRAAIARALFKRPDFLFADEPTGSLDSENAKKIIDLFLKYKNELGLGIVICSHDTTVYDKMDILFKLHDGSLVLEKH